MRCRSSAARCAAPKPGCTSCSPGSTRSSSRCWRRAARHRPAAVRAATSRGTSARSPPWMCRYCKGFASPPRARPGPIRTPASRRWTPRCRWRCRSSTAVSSRCRSPSRRTVRTGCRSTSPTPSGRADRGAGDLVRPAAQRPERRQAAGARALVLPDQALAGRQCRRPRHAGLGDRAASTPCGPRLRPRTASVPTDGDTLIHALIAAGGHDVEWLTEEQLRTRLPGCRWPPTSAGSPSCRQELQDAVTQAWGAAARLALRRRRRHRAGEPALRQRRARDPAAARIRREPDRDLPRPGPGAEPPLPRRPTGGWHTSSAPTPSSISASTARWNGCPARDWACRLPALPTPCSAICR